MKKILLLTVFMLGSLTAQTLNDIAMRHFQAIGLNKLSNVETITIKGTAYQGGNEIPITLRNKKPNKLRIDGSIKGQRFVQAYDGKNAWTINPVSGDSTAKILPDELSEDLKDQAYIEGLLFHYKNLGYEIELKESIQIENVDYYVIQLTKQSGNSITYFIDPESFLIYKTISKSKLKTMNRELETYFTNYNSVNEMLFPFNIEVTSNNYTLVQYIFDSVEFNEPMDDEIFDMNSEVEFR